MIAAEEAIALKAFFASRGIVASDRSVTRALRDQGLRFREADVRKALAGTRPAETSDAPGTQKALTRDAVGTQSGETRDATSRAPADLKGVSKLVPYVQGERKGTSSPRSDSVTSTLAPLVVEEPPPSEPASPPQLVLAAPPEPAAKPDRRTPSERVADDALALIRDVVTAELGKTKALTWSAWRSRNRRAAASLAAAGRSAQAIADLHAEVSEREGRTVLSLAHLQTAALYGERESPEARRARLEQEEWDRTRPMTVPELIAAGKLPPLPKPAPSENVVTLRRPVDPRQQRQIAEFAAAYGITL